MSQTRRGFLCSLGAVTAVGVTRSQTISAGFAPLHAEPTKQTDGLIRLNQNENAFGPSPRVVEAIRAAVESSNRYAHARGLMEYLAGVHRVGPEQVVLGCGSTEILRAAACSYLGKGKQMIQASPTFGALEHYAGAVGAEVRSVGLTAAFAHDLPSMLASTNSSTGLVYICNPNNPTATLTPRKDLEEFISKLPASALIIVDEAYHHYVAPSSTYASLLDRPVQDARVIVTRTFSKIYGLAGLRLGYAVASAKVGEQLRKFLTEDNVNCIGASAAIAALDDVEAMNDFVQRNANAKQEFFNQAMARALKPIDSHANFVMMDTLHPAKEVAGEFRKSNILIGEGSPQMKTHVRVSLGRPEEMLEFWRVWDTLPYPKHTMHH